MALNTAMQKNIALYNNLEVLLRGAKTPLTAAMCYEAASVRAAAKRPGQVNDALRSFHSRGLVRKLTYAGPGKSKISYEWGAPTPEESLMEEQIAAAKKALSKKTKVLSVPGKNPKPGISPAPVSAAPSGAPVELSMKVNKGGNKVSFALGGLLLSIEVVD